MTRAVRISPVPIPPPALPPRPRRTYGVLGAVLLVLGLLCLAAHVVVSGTERHSWDRHAVPPALVALTAGTSYLVSTADGPGATPVAAPLVCTYRVPGTGALGALAVTPVDVSSRATHAVGTFVAPVPGPVAVTCTGGVVGTRAVFVDDADDAGKDVAGLWLLLAVPLLLAGAGAVAGAAYARTGGAGGPVAAAPPDVVSGVTAGDPS